MSAYHGKIGKAYMAISTAVSAAVILLIVTILFTYSLDATIHRGLQLFTTEWNPSKGKFGILPMLYGSSVVTLIALIISVPIGLFTAIYTSEILPAGFRFYVKSILELLAGIPSIIYGLIGISFFSIWIGDLFDLQSGRSILTAGLMLSIMVLPIIITLSDDALRNVPDKYREAGKSLGLYRYEIIRDILLPIASADIVGAVLLAMGRAFGETMAVMLVIGGIDKIPESFINVLAPGQTIASKLGREIPEAAFGSLHFSAMIFMGLILLLIVLLFTTVAHHYFNPEQRLYE